MGREGYKSLEIAEGLDRRELMKLSAVGAGLLLGVPTVWAVRDEKEKAGKVARIATNVDDALKVPRTKWSIPGPFPGRVARVTNPKAMKDGKPDAKVVDEMFREGLARLTGKKPAAAFPLFFEKDDVVGIKVNPVGPGLISTRLEVVDAVIDWLEKGGIPRKNIVIWDRFDYMLTDAGYTKKRFPGVGIEGLQTMDEAAAAGQRDNSGWLKPDGHHVSEPNFDKKTFYFADVEGPRDKGYLNQHVFNGKYSYFGKLVSQRLTKIINIPVFKNTGNGISMATKNLGYGSICNTGRLHRPLFFNVCTEVLAFPCIRDRLVLNITDGLRAQYDGGPMPLSKCAWEFNTLFFATDPFAIDSVCHHLMVAERKARDVRVNEHPRYTEYLRYAQELKLGVADPKEITVVAS